MRFFEGNKEISEEEVTQLFNNEFNMKRLNYKGEIDINTLQDLQNRIQKIHIAPAGD